MRHTKGKWKASYKDTWDMEHCLRPIIGAGVKKFLEILKTKEYSGTPTSMFELVGVEDCSDVTPEQHEEAHSLWIGILEKVSFAFNSVEPNIDDYKFDIDLERGEREDGLLVSKITVSNKRHNNESN